MHPFLQSAIYFAWPQCEHHWEKRDGNIVDTWKQSYDAALREKDDGKRQQRMAAAKNAIVDRLEDSLHGRQPLSCSERVQIEQACRELLHSRNDRRAA